MDTKTNASSRAREGALIKRTNRQLAYRRQRLRKFRRGTPYGEKVGRYYVTDDRNNIVWAGDDLDQFANDVGASLAGLPA